MVILTCSVDMLERRQTPCLHLVDHFLHAIFARDVTFDGRDSRLRPDVAVQLLSRSLVAHHGQDFSLRAQCCDAYRHTNVACGADDEDSFHLVLSCLVFIGLTALLFSLPLDSFKQDTIRLLPPSTLSLYNVDSTESIYLFKSPQSRHESQGSTNRDIPDPPPSITG